MSAETPADGARAKLEARYFLYTLFQVLLGEAPSRERLEAMSPEAVGAALETIGMHGCPSLPKAIGGAARDLEAAKREYTRLFLGPAVLPVPMWESTYAAKENIIFTKDTLRVRSFYRRNGVLPALYPRFADDHIAFEVGFMACLAERMVEAQAEGDAEGHRSSLAASRQFLDEHLGTWVDEWSSAMNDAAENELYAVAASAVADLVREDRRLLQTIGE